MCGRFSRWVGIDVLLDKFGAIAQTAYRPSYNIAPRSVTSIVHKSVNTFILTSKEWGYQLFENYLINVRGERLSQRIYSNSFQNGRVIIPATGFYEWKDGIPYHISTGDLMSLGGILSPINDGFAIITVPSSDKMQGIHSRMPLIINDEDIEEWLTGSYCYDLVRSSELNLEITRVSDYVNDPKNDSEKCLHPSNQSTLDNYFN